MLSKAIEEYYRGTLVGIHANLIVHEVAQEHLSCKNVTLRSYEIQPDQDIEMDFFDPPVTVSGLEFTHLFAIFNGSNANQRPERRKSGDLIHPGEYITVTNRQIIEVGHKNKIGLYKELSGASGLVIDGLFISHFMLRKNTAPPLLGTIAFSLCAIQAFLLGIAKIELIAAGGEGFNPIYYGYKVWPKFGFNADIDPNEFNADKAPQLAGCATVLDAMDRDPEAWAKHGSQRVMSFDLTPGSRSWVQLIKYLSHLGF